MVVDLNQLTDEELDAIIVGARVDAHDAKQWKLTPRQQFAEDLTRSAEPGVAFELLFGGAAGGGKSAWMLWHLYTIALTYPGTRSLFLRKTFPELRRNAIYKSFEIFDQKHCKYMAAEKEWRFHNGSVIEFGFADADLDVYQYQGAEYACICMDEATQHATDFIYTYLFSRLRVTKALAAMGITPHAILATNPGNVGAGWVRARFIDIGDPDIVHEVTDEETGRKFRRVFVPSRLKDNPHLDEHSYRAQLAGLSPALRKALEDGNWDVVDGAYFPEWDRDLHVVEPFDIPEWWTRVRAIDYGYTAPMGCLWFAFDGDGNAYVYRELYERELTPPIQARKIITMTGNERVDYTVADPSIWTRTGVGLPIAQQYADSGLHTRRALNARIDGWQRVRWYLRPDPERANPRAEKYVPPKLFVFSHCKNLIRTLPMLVHDSKKPEDLDTHGDDHLADCLPANSRILTDAGEVPIADIAPGVKVLTRKGWRRVTDQWSAGQNRLIEIEVSDGSVLRCTPGHRVWVNDQWMDADDVRYGDTMLGWSRQSHSTGSSFGAIRKAKTGRSASTTSLTGPRASAALGDFTKRFTKPIMAQSLTGSTSTTEMATHSTTPRTTLKQSKQATIYPSTAEAGNSIPNITHGCWNAQPTGTGQPKGANGTGFTASEYGLGDNQKPEFANIAEPATRQSPVEGGSARTTAKPRRDALLALMTKPASVWRAARNTLQTATQQHVLVPVHVVRVSERTEVEEVFDLSVEGEHEFFADGLLVHNCLRYGLMSRPRMSVAKVAEETTLEARLAAKHRAPKRAHDAWIGT